jgi:single stranded DNA-binding protein
MAGPCGARCARPLGIEKRYAASLVTSGAAPNTARRCKIKMNNSITIVGYVGQNPKSVSFGDTGNKVVKFSVAVKDFSSNSDEQKTMWVDVDAWNGLGERVLSTITKGREVVVNGRLALSSYYKDVNGEKVQMTKPVIKLTSFHLCGKKPTTTDEATPTEEARANASKKKLTALRN